MADQVILLEILRGINDKQEQFWLIIAATAIHFEMPVASLNVKHFTDIDDLKIYKF